jgi:multiple sugar transport system permease protein
VLCLVFFALPIVFAVVQSVQRTTKSGLGLGEAKTVFAGLDNFVAVLSDSGVRAGFGRVFLIGIIQVPTMLFLALVLALLFDSTLVRFRQFFQMSAFLPHAIPGVIGALLWGFLYLPGLSPIIKALDALGAQVDLLGHGTVLFAVINITTWSWTGYNMIIIYAALQSIPRDLYEAASIDGASGFRIATQIKVPLVAPALVITLVFSIIGSLQQFADPAVLAGITSAIDSRFTPNLAVYNLAMNENQPGQAAALSLVVAVLAFALSIAVLRLRDRPRRRRKEAR